MVKAQLSKQSGSLGKSLTRGRTVKSMACPGTTRNPLSFKRRWCAAQLLAHGLLEWEELDSDEANHLIDLADQEQVLDRRTLVGPLEFTGKLRREGDSLALPGWLEALLGPGWSGPEGDG